MFSRNESKKTDKFASLLITSTQKIRNVNERKRMSRHVTHNSFVGNAFKKKKETLDDIPHNVYKHVTTPLHHLPLHLLAKNEEKKENETEQTPVDCIVFPGSGTEVSRRPFRQREATR